MPTLFEAHWWARRSRAEAHPTSLLCTYKSEYTVIWSVVSTG
ncbi:MAG: hypothetical protein Q8R24_01935 [Legionellaceae bacterium]|nr:hypothetical protein [Legionellaceae bacterium]